jgi:hypothetical protein
MTHLEDHSKILDVDSHDADPSFKMVDGLDMFMSLISILYQTIEFVSEVDELSCEVYIFLMVTRIPTSSQFSCRRRSLRWSLLRNDLLF